MFVNVPMSLRLFWWIQLYVNLFQHFYFHNLFHLVHSKVFDEANAWTSYCHKQNF